MSLLKLNEQLIREIMRCQGERDYFEGKKRCYKCEHRDCCSKCKTKLYFWHKDDEYIFAFIIDDAMDYFTKGYGTKLEEDFVEKPLASWKH